MNPIHNVLLAGLAGACLISLSFSTGAAPPAPLPTAIAPANSLYSLATVWQDQNKANVKLAHYAGQYVLMAMIYTHCKDMCPMTVATLRKLVEDWQAQKLPPVHVVLVSLDEARDTPQALQAFAAEYHLPADTWSLLVGARADVRRLSVLLGMSYQKLENGDIAHSNLITLLAPDGHMLGQAAGFTADVAALLKLVKTN